MIRQLFVRPKTISRLESNPISPQLNSLATAMKKQRYANGTIGRYLSICDVFGRWLGKNAIPLSSVTDHTIRHFLSLPAGSVGSTDKRWNKAAGSPIRMLLRHLQETGAANRVIDDGVALDEVQKCVTEYGHHLEKVQGVCKSTRQHYLCYAAKLLNAHSNGGFVDWSSINAEKLAAFVQRETMNRKGFGPQSFAGGVRSFVRFLIVQNILPAGMEAALPTIKRWSHCSLPQRLSEAELKSLLDHGRADVTPLGKRNYAIVLLLARLALRAGEVLRLQLEDLDWLNGRVIVRASKRRERMLPLSKEVAEALIDYLQHSRPTTTHREVFLAHTAPFLPFQHTKAITYAVQCLFAKAGIKRDSRGGAHLLRHTLATHMVNKGVSFKDTADFLGHRALQTTGIYAKLDLASLSQIALPWPGGVR